MKRKSKDLREIGAVLFDIEVPRKRRSNVQKQRKSRGRKRVSPVSEIQPVLKSLGEPVIQPIPHHRWESKATFNPAAVYEDGKVHIVYRAVGDEYISVFGYASSKDGLHVDERLKEPIFAIRVREHAEAKIQPIYFSGPGWYGGCEDPRITKLEGRFYMPFVSFDGGPPRIALTSIKVSDFLNRNWKWDIPVLISRPEVVDKNPAILPERIDGRYVIFHRIFPSILIDFVDSLKFDGKTFLKGQFSIGPRKGMWDSLKLGCGPPPVKTKDGWLLIYHAVDEKDPTYTYKIGAMILDINDPTKVLYRCTKPILEPGEDDCRVTYPCGAVVIKGTLFVYYGSGDRTTKVATANLNDLLDSLKASKEPKIVPVSVMRL